MNYEEAKQYETVCEELGILRSEIRRLHLRILQMEAENHWLRERCSELGGWVKKEAMVAKVGLDEVQRENARADALEKCGEGWLDILNAWVPEFRMEELRRAWEEAKNA